MKYLVSYGGMGFSLLGAALSVHLHEWNLVFWQVMCAGWIGLYIGVSKQRDALLG